MKDGRPTADDPSLVERGEQRLFRGESGGFRLEQAGGTAIEVSPADGDWVVRFPSQAESWRLGRGAADTGGFVLGTDDGETEAGRTTPLGRLGSAADLYYVLLGDGRLFRISLRGPRESGFELVGWETPGAYLIARPGSRGWTLVPTPACGGLSDIRALSILFAAEILDSEEPLT